MDKVYREMQQEKLDALENLINALVHNMASYHYCNTELEVQRMSSALQRAVVNLSYGITLYNKSRDAEEAFTKLYHGEQTKENEPARQAWHNVSEEFTQHMDKAIEDINSYV